MLVQVCRLDWQNQKLSQPYSNRTGPVEDKTDVSDVGCQIDGKETANSSRGSAGEHAAPPDSSLIAQQGADSRDDLCNILALIVCSSSDRCRKTNRQLSYQSLIYSVIRSPICTSVPNSYLSSRNDYNRDQSKHRSVCSWNIMETFRWSEMMLMAIYAHCIRSD